MHFRVQLLGRQHRARTRVDAHGGHARAEVTCVFAVPADDFVVSHRPAHVRGRTCRIALDTVCHAGNQGVAPWRAPCSSLQPGVPLRKNACNNEFKER
jgi:hypothetical protein